MNKIDQIKNVVFIQLKEITKDFFENQLFKVWTEYETISNWFC